MVRKRACGRARNQIQPEEGGQDRTLVPRQCLAFHGVTQLPPPACHETPCKASARTPKPETAATPLPCPDLPGRNGPACPGSVSAGAEGWLPTGVQAACPPPGWACTMGL